jgi:putative transposase
VGIARRRYEEFVREGIIQGKRVDLTGGGLIRSHGGWAAVSAMRRAKIFQKSDERILGDGDFVEEVLSASQECMEGKSLLQARGIGLSRIGSRVSELMGVEPLGLWGPGKERKRVSARSLLCYWAVRDLGMSMAELSRRLRLSLSGVSHSVKRGEKISQNRGYKLNES